MPHHPKCLIGDWASGSKREFKLRHCFLCKISNVIISKNVRWHSLKRILCHIQKQIILSIFYCIYGREQVPASHQDNARVETRRPPQPQQWAQQTSALGRGGHSCFRGPQILMSIQYSQCSEQVPILGASSRCWNCLSSTNIFGHLFPNIFTVRQF